MPEKHVKFYFAEDSPPPMDMLFETFDCPKCGCRFPVKEEIVDYRELYEQTKRFFQKQDQCFRTFIDELANEVPEAKIYLHNKHQSLINTLKELQKLYKDGEI